MGTAEDAKNLRLVHVMANFFDSIKVAPGVHANGEFTLGETLPITVDLYHIRYQKSDGCGSVENWKRIYTRTALFLSYANVWAGNIRPEEILKRTKTDPHSLGKWRVDGALPQIGAWYEAFNITEKDPMYLPVDKRVSIW